MHAFLTLLELHSTLRAWFGQAGSTGTEQRENAAKNGRLRANWTCSERQGEELCLLYILTSELLLYTVIQVWTLLPFLPLQTLSFYFHSCGKIPPPVIMVQNVSFRYSDNTVGHRLLHSWIMYKALRLSAVLSTWPDAAFIRLFLLDNAQLALI